MTYLINKTDGTLLATVLEGAVDRSHCGLALIGRKVSNYGEIQNENFVRLAENFASPYSPTSPIEGQIWWNSATRTLTVFDGTSWARLPKWGSVPSSARGAQGDVAGMVALDTSYIYTCTHDFDGTTNIWARTSLNTTW